MRDAKRPRSDAAEPGSLREELDHAQRKLADIALECLCGVCMELYSRPCA